MRWRTGTLGKAVPLTNSNLACPITLLQGLVRNLALFLNQGSVTFSCKGPDNKCFRFGRSYSLRHNDTPLLLQLENSHIITINK